jgi:hypothetical protein
MCGYNYTNTKGWTLYKVDSATGATLGSAIDLTSDPLSFSGFDSATLVVYPNVLDYGIYLFTYSVRILYSMDGGATTLTLQAQTSTYVEYVKTGLNIFGFLNGILQQTYGMSQQIVIDPGTNSIDLDNVVNPSTLNYTFYCQKVPSGQSTSAYFSSGGAITQLGSTNLYQVYSPTFASDCFTSKCLP